MSPYSDLEIVLRRRNDQEYWIEFTFRDGDRETGAPGVVVPKSDFDAIRGLRSDPAEYGNALAKILFRDRLGVTFEKSRSATQIRGVGLRVRLRLDPDVAELNAICWECVRDPEGNRLLTGEEVVFSRFLKSVDNRSFDPKAVTELKVLVVVSNPSNLASYNCNPIDAQNVIQQVEAAAGVMSVASLENATLDNIGEKLREGFDILYLIAHGSLSGGKHRLLMEDEKGEAAVVEGTRLADCLREVSARPQLVVLGSCESAGEEGLAALGPQLALAGIPAVVAMQGKLLLKSEALFVPRFFRELAREGQIERALAAARETIRNEPDYFVPVLYTQLLTGKLWSPQAVVPDLFLCHSPTDQPEAVRIARELRRSGRQVTSGDPGDPKLPDLGATLQRSKSIAVVVGKSGLTPYQKEPVRTAIEARAAAGIPVMAVLLSGATEEQAGALLRNRVPLKLPAALDAQVLRPLLEMAAGGSPQVPPAEAVAADVQSPYRGLEAYDSGNEKLFFGRTTEIARAVDLLERTLPDATRWLAVLGASGAGKSSLLRAGIVPRLMERHPDWKLAVLTPGSNPLESLADPVLKLAGAKPGGIADFATRARTEERTLQQELAGMLGAAERVLLVVDQFEELFTQCGDEKLRSMFVANLLCAAREASGKAVVVLSMRSDASKSCAAYPALADAMRQQILVRALSREGLISAIEEPARAKKVVFEAGLAERLADDCLEQGSQLPLLQIVLVRLWSKRTIGGVIPNSAYGAGGIASAIDDHAELVWESLDESGQRDGIQLFLKLVATPDGTHFFRRARRVPDLAPAGAAGDERHFEELLGRLAGPRARLLTFEADRESATIAFAHESLLAHWARLAKLLEDEREFLEWMQRLDVSVADWKREPGEGAYLRGAMLARALKYRKERPNGYTREQENYLLACEKRQWRGRLLAAVAAGLVLVLLGAAAYRLESAREVTVLESKVGQLLDGKRPGLGLVIALEAVTRDVSALPVLERAVQALSEDPQLMLTGQTPAMALADNGNLVVAAEEGTSKALALWRPLDEKKSPVWGLATPTPDMLPFGENPPVLAAVSANGKMAGGADEKGTIKLWRLDATPVPLEAPKPSGIVSVMALDDAGEVLAYATNRTVILWDVAKHSELVKIEAPDKVSSLALHPSKREVAVGTIDGFVRLWAWTPAGPPQSGPALQHEDHIQVNYARYADAGRVLATATDHRHAYRWDLSSAGNKKVLGDDVKAAAISADGTLMATVNAVSRSISLWDSSGKELHTFAEVDDVQAMALDRSGGRLMTRAPNGVRVYDFSPQELSQRAWELLTRVLTKDLEGCEAILGSDCEKYRDKAQK